MSIEKKRAIKSICKNCEHTFRLEGMIYIHNKYDRTINITEKDFGYRLARNPYEAILIGEPILCPIEEQEHELSYIYDKSEEHDYLLKDNKEYIDSIDYNTLKNLTWADLNNK